MFARILITGLKLEGKISDLHEGLKNDTTQYKSETKQSTRKFQEDLGFLDKAFSILRRP